MSYNYLEVAAACEQISAQLFAPGSTGVVESVDYVRFPVSDDLPDLNLGIKVDGRYIVFSLKSPWVAIHSHIANAFWVDHKKNPEFKTELTGTRILGIHAHENERIVTIEFSNQSFLTVELFSAKPRVVFSKEKPEYKTGKTADEKFTLRDFGGLVASYNFYLEKRWQDYAKLLIQTAARGLDSRSARLVKIKTELSRQSKESSAADEVRSEAENLKAHLHEFQGKEHADKVEEVEKNFTRYKKLVRTAKEIKPRSEKVDSELARSRTLLRELNTFKKTATESWKDFIKRFKTFAKENDLLGSASEDPAKKNLKKKDKAWQKSGIRRYVSKEGLNIWVGRSHEENEELVIRLAKGNDLWFHLKGKPGAHVVVQVMKGKSASLETMLDAANLCVHFSNINAADKVDVDYTFRKNVKRVAGKGANSNGKFLVNYTQNKTLVVKIDQARLTRLLSSALL